MKYLNLVDNIRVAEEEKESRLRASTIGWPVKEQTNAEMREGDNLLAAAEEDKHDEGLSRIRRMATKETQAVKEQAYFFINKV